MWVVCVDLQLEDCIVEGRVIGCDLQLDCSIFVNDLHAILLELVALTERDCRLVSEDDLGGG